MSSSSYNNIRDLESQQSSSASSWEQPIFTSSTNHTGRERNNNGLPKQLFHGLATLLIVSLCILLVELNSPGVATRLSHKMQGYWAWIPDDVKESKSLRENVPSPFVYSKGGKLAAFAPTSEPTVLTHMDFMSSPTSEPTEFKDIVSSFILVAPTSEPTEIRDAAEHDFVVKNSLEAIVPTSEPTVFAQSIESSPSSQPSSHSSDASIVSAIPTMEPTIFAGVPPPLDNGPESTSEPTFEPTIFAGLPPPSDEPSIPVNGAPTSEPTIFYNSNTSPGSGSSPTSEPTIFFASGPVLNTFSPSQVNSFAPTSDPTTFPTPEPTISVV